MQLIILGKTSNDKGRELETLVASLLKSLGYTEVNVREIRAGGEELDVVAQLNSPSLGGAGHTIDVICECKAYKSPVAISDWLKFLGKIYSANARSKSNLRGCFIALSGVNGNVSGHFKELKENTSEIELVSGEELLQAIGKQFNLADIEMVTKYVAQLTQRRTTIISLCLHKGSLTWVIQFSDDTYTLLPGDGSQQPVQEVDSITDLLGATIPGEYIDIAAEEKAHVRRLKVEKSVASSLMLLGGAGTAKQVRQCWDENTPDTEAARISDDEIAQATESLVDKGYVGKEEKEDLLTLLPNGRGSDEAFATAFLIYFFERLFVTPALGCDYYDSLIDDSLLSAICDIQGGMIIPEDRKPDCIRLLRWSPSALAWSLTADPMIATKRKPSPEATESKRSFDEDDLNYFMSAAADKLAEDFDRQELSKYFCYVRRLHELDWQRSLQVKSKDKLEATVKLRDRLGIFEATADLGGGLVRIRMNNQAPDPWEFLGNAENGDS